MFSEIARATHKGFRGKLYLKNKKNYRFWAVKTSI